MNNQLIIEKDFEKNFSDILVENKFKECLVVTSDGNERRGYHDSFIELIEKNKSNFFVHKINKYPNLLEIEKIFKNYRDKNIDLVLSIGGGSVIDAGKLFSSCKTSGSKLNDISNLKNRSPQNSIFTIAIPTTSGSGAESTKFATIWSEETKQKFSYENENLLPEVVYLIPEYTKSLNYDLTLTTTLDALCHAVDSLLNKNSNHESIRLSKEAIEKTNSNFSLLLENLENIDYRAEALYASNLSGRAINISRTSLNHSISYPLTNYYGLPHGLACAFSVISTIEYFKTDIKKSDFAKFLFMASDTIKELQLSRIYRRHLNKLDVEIISNNTLKNSRSNNFPYELGSKIVQEILNESKKYYLTE
tara:strand:- start:254 stop:1342 length:1089 start_codon:yes stop_codon:yes gene_type:complete